jgi:type IV secretory pathway VirB2 component (pilin)
MKLHRNISRLRLVSLRVVPFVLLGLVIAAPAFAQATSPWENAVGVLQQAFTSTIARGLSLVAIVVSGLTFAFGEGGSKRVLAGVLFGVGIAMNPPPSFPAIVGLILRRSCCTQYEFDNAPSALTLFDLFS